MTDPKKPWETPDQKKEDAPSLSTQEQLLGVLDRLTQIQERQPIPQQSVAQATYTTPWNPTGKKTRVRLRRRVFLNGHALSDGRLTEEEIELLNGLKNGRYRQRQWTVLEKDEEGTNSMHVYIPNKTEAQRIDLARLAPKGLSDLLRLMHDEMKKPRLE